MLNKKIGLLVLAAATLGLAACGGNNSSQSSNPTGASTGTPAGESAPTGVSTGTPAGESQPTGVSSAASAAEAIIPSVEGKIGIYFHFADSETVKLAELPTYVSPWITGNWNGYATNAEGGAVEMVRKADTDVFYGYIPADGDLGDLGYQITLGYNSTSGVATNLQGIDWNYKTNWSADNYLGLDHPFMTKVADDLYVCRADTVDALDFKEVLPEPIMVKKQSFKFKISDSLKTALTGQDNLELVVKGSFNGWATVSAGKADTDGYYTVPLVSGDAQMVLGTVQMCIGVRNAIAGGNMEDKYNLALAPAGDFDDVWGAGGVEALEGEVYKISNITLAMSKLYQEEGWVYDLGTVTLPEHANGTAEAYKLPSNEAPTLPTNLVITLKNTAETAFTLVDQKFVSIAGTINGWKHEQMIEVVPGKEYRYVISGDIFLGQKLEFKFADGDWNRDEVAPSAEGGNFELTPEIGKVAYTVSADLTDFGAGDATHFVGELKNEEIALDHDIEFRVFNSIENPVEKACIAGDFQGWDAAKTELVNDPSKGYYAATLEKGALKTGSVINFKITNGTWDKNVGKAGENFSLVLPYGAVAVELKADMTTFTGDIEFVSWVYALAD